MVLKQPEPWDKLPPELQVHILTYLRSYDLSAVQRTCRYFSSRSLIQSVIKHTAVHVYPQEWTKEVMKQHQNIYTFQLLRDMEWCVVAKVLSSPEPHLNKGGYYVSKSWCRTALKWLEVQQHEQKLREQQQESAHGNGKHGKKKKKKMSKKEQRQRNRRLSDAMPPWSNVNSDLTCEHSNLQVLGGSKAARARRRLVDKHAWKMLKKLYPDSTALDSVEGECVCCRLERESAKREQQLVEDRKKQERKLPLSDALVRGIYTRSRGVPNQSLAASQTNNNQIGGEDTKIPAMMPSSSKCPLVPGLYHILPRAWLHKWRKYLKTGEGEQPCPPDASALLCHGHRLPVLPPHLEAYLRGETPQLFWSSSHAAAAFAGATMGHTPSTPSRTPAMTQVVVGMSPDVDTLNALRAAGVSQQELDSQQRLARLSLQNSNNVATIHTLGTTDGIRSNSSSSNNNNSLNHNMGAVRASTTTTTTNNNNSNTNEMLDKENSVVVEILTDEEYSALVKWWPHVHSLFCLRFSVCDSGVVEWSVPPCRECDASGKANAVLPNLIKMNQQQLQSQQQHHQSNNTHKKKYHPNSQKQNKQTVSVDLIDY